MKENPKLVLSRRTFLVLVCWFFPKVETIPQLSDCVGRSSSSKRVCDTYCDRVLPTGFYVVSGGRTRGRPSSFLVYVLQGNPGNHVRVHVYTLIDFVSLAVMSVVFSASQNVI